MIIQTIAICNQNLLTELLQIYKGLCAAAFGGLPPPVIPGGQPYDK
jgi:hypothetical protein